MAITINHFSIRTTDLEASRRFYADVLGLTVGPRPAFPFPGLWMYRGDHGDVANAVVHIIGTDRTEEAGLDDYLGERDETKLRGTGSIDHVAFFADRVGLTAAELTSLTSGSPNDDCWTDPAERALLELVDALDAGASIGRVRMVQSVLTKWRRFWSDVALTLLSKEQQLGLFGELWFLARWLLPSIGTEPSALMWRGPLGARNDFEQPGWAVEVKTSGKLDGSHQIHGLEQLLEPQGVELFLFSLLVRDEASGAESLPKVVAELRGAVAGNHVLLSQFEGMLAAARYDDTYTAEYDKLKLRIRSQGLYRVAQGFPRLVPNSISEGLPLCVSNVNYDLRLDAAGPWLVGESPTMVQELLKGLSEKA